MSPPLLQSEVLRPPSPAEVKDRIRRIRTRAGVYAGDAGFRKRVSELIVVGSASRSGSSLLAEMLRHSRRFLHLPAEINPYLVVNGLSFPASGTGSDRLDGSEAGEHVLDELAAELAADAGQPSSSLDTDESVWRFAVDLTCRLTMQWPEDQFEVDEIERVVRRCLDTLVESRGWPASCFVDARAFHQLFLSIIAETHRSVCLGSYDFGPGIIQRPRSGAQHAEGPPRGMLIEEPPLVTIQPWTHSSGDASSNVRLVVKTPSNAYRINFLRRLFPNAKLRLVHLSRNFAASVNGLCAGWMYPGFFSHELPRALAIRGYSERFPAWGSRWWKFDLPPGWENVISEPLESVCSFQWLSAHRALLAERDLEVFRIKFEDIVRDSYSRRRIFDELFCWLGCALDQPIRSLLEGELPIVMATQAPATRQRRERTELIEPLLCDPRVIEVMERLGYGDQPSRWP
jgi:hypothetical protein